MTTKRNARQGQDDSARREVRIDLIDNDHDDWHRVLASMDGKRSKGALMLNDGFLSARQSLLVARAGEKVVGHLCFHVEPLVSKGTSESGCVEARVDALEVQPGFGEKEVKDLLMVAARKRASLLRCARLIGLPRR